MNIWQPAEGSLYILYICRLLLFFGIVSLGVFKLVMGCWFSLGCAAWLAAVFHHVEGSEWLLMKRNTSLEAEATVGFLHYSTHLKQK